MTPETMSFDLLRAISVMSPGNPSSGLAVEIVPARWISDAVTLSELPSNVRP